MENIKKLKQISEDLFTIANSYAGNETGIEASLIHLTQGNLQHAINSLEGNVKVSEFTILENCKKWVSDINFLKAFN